MTEHINLAGRYHLELPEPIRLGEYPMLSAVEFGARVGLLVPLSW